MISELSEEQEVKIRGGPPKSVSKYELSRRAKREVAAVIVPFPSTSSFENPCDSGMNLIMRAYLPLRMSPMSSAPWIDESM